MKIEISNEDYDMIVESLIYNNYRYNLMFDLSNDLNERYFIKNKMIINNKLQNYLKGIIKNEKRS